MKRSLAITAAVVGALVLSISPAWAEDEELPMTSEFFEEYDRNADGIVSQDEFTGSGEVFRLLDSDKDGKITAQELGLPADYRPDPNAKAKREKAARSNKGKAQNAQRRERIKQMFKAWDANKDGAISREEWMGDAGAFDRIDRNDDGKIDKQDLRGLLGDQMDGGMMDGMDGPDAAPMGGKDATKRGPKPNKKAREGRGARLLKKLDANQDGKISADEWRGKPEKFDAMDKDGSGFVEAAELGIGATDAAPKRAKPSDRFNPDQVKTRFTGLDKDGDGELTTSDGLGEGMLMRMDADQSGGVSLDEFTAAVQKARRGQAQRQKASAKRMIKRFDTDKDGQVSRDEFPGSDERFDGMDKNGDGYLNEADFGDAPAKPKKDAAPITPGGSDG